MFDNLEIKELIKFEFSTDYNNCNLEFKNEEQADLAIKKLLDQVWYGKRINLSIYVPTFLRN